MLLIRKEGFADKPPTPKQIEFDDETRAIPWLLTISTDESSPTMKKIREAAAIGQASTQNVKFEDIEYAKVINAINSKYNEDRAASTAYKVAKSFKIPHPHDDAYKKGGFGEAANVLVLEFLKKLHKKMPSYPFSQTATEGLKKESLKKIPKIEECKGYFKCSGIEKIPKSLD